MDTKQLFQFYARLTERQQQVLQLASEGYTNREIANLLYIQPCVVAEHLTAIYDRLHVFMGICDHPRPTRYVLFRNFSHFFMAHPELRQVEPL